MRFLTDHACIKVGDLEKELAFYRDALGFCEQSRCKHTEQILSVFLGAAEGGGAQLQLLSLPGYVPDMQAYGHFAVRTEDIGSAHRFHTDMGCATGGIVDQGHQYSYFIRDPEGYETEIIQPKGEARQA